MPGRAFRHDGRSITTESATLAAMTRPARTRDGHEPASGWRLPCTGVSSAASPVTKSATGRVTRGKDAMSYQPMPDYEAGTAANNPPGWYLDPIGLRSLRWWDGAHWVRIRNPCSDHHGSARLRTRTLSRPLQADTARSASRAPAATGSRTARNAAREMRRAPVKASICIQASSSPASAVISHQTWFCS